MRFPLLVSMLASCGRIDFDPDRGPCNVQGRAGDPFATADAPYLICTADQLDQIGAHPELWSAAFALGADLDVSAREPVPYIGTDATPFDGTFDGGGHTITGLHYDDPVSTEVALFPHIGPDAHLANLVLAAVDIAAPGGSAAALVGYGYGGIIEDITMDGRVSSGDLSGGVIADIECYDSPTTPCPNGIVVRHITVSAAIESTATFSGAGGVFGLAGMLASTAMFTDLHSSGTVTGAKEVGGLGGDVEGIDMEDSDSSMTITAVGRAGGLTGEITYGSTVIKRCHASGDVHCSDGLCGGAIPETDGAGVTQVSASGNVTCTNAACGGAFGDIGGPIVECYATGTVTGGAGTIGGLVGYAEMGVIDSYATGTVNGGGDDVGGLVGGSSGDVLRSYATGAVMTTGAYAGGLVGDFGGNHAIVDSFSANLVTGTSAMRLVGPLLGGSVGTYTSTANVTSATCMNTAGTCTADPSATVVGSSQYFATVTNAPMSTWDFAGVWRAVPGAPPALRNAP